LFFGNSKPQLRWVPVMLTIIWILSGTLTNLVFQAL
jgi:hypothetical protein